MDRGAPTAYGKVREFLVWLSTDASGFPVRKHLDMVLEHPVARRIEHECVEAVSCGLYGRFYRGQRLSEGANPDVDRLLAPLPERVSEATKPTEGRYNKGGDPVLYLCRKEDIVPDEVPLKDPDKPDLHVLEFEMSLDDIRIIPMQSTDNTDYPHLHNLLFLTEYEPREDREIDVYRATHFIREVCRKHGIDAVEYPSIEGGYVKDRDALNVVVFDEAIRRVEEQAEGPPSRYTKR